MSGLPISVLRRALAPGLLVLALGSVPALGQEGGGDNAAVAINTRDGATVFRLAFSIRRVMRDVVDQSNAAVAYASCEDCRTVAIAIQAVLVFSDPSVVTPQNIAIAINEQCTLCETLATAYQFVLGTGGPVHFTADGNRAIAAIRRQLQELRKSEASIEELQAQVDAIVGELELVLATELVAAGRPRPETEGEPTTEEPQPVEPSATPSATPAPGASAEPTPSPTPSPIPS